MPTEHIAVESPVAPLDARAIALCVDLDGTLLHSDLLWESVAILLREKPWLAFALPFWLLKGRAALKRRILEHIHLPVEALPYNRELIAWLKAEKAQGRVLVLATASDRIVVEKVAAHLDLFDLVLSSDGERNLKGAAKLAALKSRFGSQFDYVGDAAVDLAIWRECRHAILVDPSPRVAAAARQTARVQRTFTSRPPLVPLIIRQMRPHQWMKNLLVFVPLITSHQFTHPALLLKAAIAFLSFGLIASSVYVLNDLLDLQSDRLHHRKRSRPFASGQLSLPWAFFLVPALLASGFGLVAWLIPSALGVLLIYYVLTCLYSYWLKGKLLLDVFALGGLYTIRIVMGSAAYHVDLSVWLLSFSMFLFLSLGFAKRSAELYNVASAGGEANRRRAYKPSDLPVVNIFGIAAGFSSSLVLTLYMNSENMRVLYSNPDVLWLLFPLVLYWLSRIWIIASRGEMDEDPVLFAAKDRTTILVVLAGAFVMWLATHNWVHLV
jgi:4-hydroxybenzoate polyprenyltransferase/phosphoserine phosphatase